MRAITHPSGNLYYYSEGVVARHTVNERRGEMSKRMEITADYAVGSSGGPIFDEAGNLVGLVSTTRRYQTKGLHILFNNLTKTADKSRAKRKCRASNQKRGTPKYKHLATLLTHQTLYLIIERICTQIDRNNFTLTIYKEVLRYSPDSVKFCGRFFPSLQAGYMMPRHSVLFDGFQPLRTIAIK